MAEPEIVVANREHLWWLLAEAAQLEHMIMCQYLFAEFSLKSDDELAADQIDVVDRWRKTLRGIAVEEMLHLALVANLMAAIGAAPTFGRPNFPRRSGYFPPNVQLDLLPFGEQALLHFLYLERPERMERQDAEGFVPMAPPLEPLDAGEAMPYGQEFATVGHLYRGIERGLATLADRLGERALFVGSPRAQATPERFGWPQVIAVSPPRSPPLTRSSSRAKGLAATGRTHTTGGSSRCGKSTTSCIGATRRSSRVGLWSPHTPGSRSTLSARCRSSQIRTPAGWPSWLRLVTSWCCTC
jgi:ferritin-like protein